MRRIVGRGDSDAVDVTFDVREVPRRELGQHLLADVRHVQLDDREAEHGRHSLWTGRRARRDDEVPQRHQDERVLAAKSGSAVERPPGVEVAKFLLDLRAPLLERWPPLGGFECVDDQGSIA